MLDEVISVEVISRDGGRMRYWPLNISRWRGLGEMLTVKLVPGGRELDESLTVKISPGVRGLVEV